MNCLILHSLIARKARQITLLKVVMIILTWNYKLLISLDIADGLKELLIKYRFTLKELLSIPASELAEFLGTDLYVAKIICGAARKLSNYNYHI